MGYWDISGPRTILIEVSIRRNESKPTFLKRTVRGFQVSSWDAYQPIDSTASQSGPPLTKMTVKVNHTIVDNSAEVI